MKWWKLVISLLVAKKVLVSMYQKNPILSYITYTHTCVIKISDYRNLLDVVVHPPKTLRCSWTFSYMSQFKANLSFCVDGFPRDLVVSERNTYSGDLVSNSLNTSCNFFIFLLFLSCLMFVENSFGCQIQLPMSRLTVVFFEHSKLPTNFKMLNYRCLDKVPEALGYSIFILLEAILW